LVEDIKAVAGKTISIEFPRTNPIDRLEIPRITCVKTKPISDETPDLGGFTNRPHPQKIVAAIPFEHTSKEIKSRSSLKALNSKHQH
jgi:hypothetical protein